MPTLPNIIKGVNTPKIKPDDIYRIKLISSESLNLFLNVINGYAKSRQKNKANGKVIKPNNVAAPP